MGESMERNGGDLIRDVMLFRDARGWGVTATLGGRNCRHWRLRTEAHARYLAAVLELGPAILPTGSSGSRRHARQLGRETCPNLVPAPRRIPDWPGGPPRARARETVSENRGCRFDSLSAAVESALQLAESASAAASLRGLELPWDEAVPDDATASGFGCGEAASLSAALDAELADRADDEIEAPCARASGDFI